LAAVRIRVAIMRITLMTDNKAYVLLFT